MKYSVIIPAYNAEKTISRCLDSLLAGIRADVEILLINDGSEDKTDEICRQYASRTPQIRYLTQGNGGVSSARNLGLKHACGNYITFVDSDDYVSADFFSVIDSHLTHGCDFLMCGKSEFDGTTTKVSPLYDHVTTTPADTAALLSRALIRQRLNPPFAKVFRRAIIAEYGLSFDERLSIAEDKVFVVQYICHAQNAVFLREPLYTLSVENRQSLSRKKRADLCDHILLEHRLLFEAAEKSPYRRDLLRSVSYSYHRSAYTVIAELRKFEYSRARRLQETRRVCRRYAERKGCTYCSLRHWLLSLPIRFEMAAFIDFVLGCKRLK